MRKSMLGPTKLMLIDDLAPEDLAMLQALYSRSGESAEVHLEKVRKAGSGKFMSSHYVGYGHKSIADCGTTTLFIEDVSLLAAKAIQDWPLYCGQETSTRYINMSARRIVDPLDTPESRKILQNWMDFYTQHQAAVSEHIRARYPRQAHEKQEDYDRAVAARTFDTMRGFLPAGITTQLSWHTNLRQAGDHLVGLSQHPSEEIRSLGGAIRGLLAEQYPSSGAGMSLAGVSGVSNRDAMAAEARAAWDADVAEETTYFESREDEQPLWMRSSLQTLPSTKKDLLKKRPRGSVLPHIYSMYGQLQFGFGLDFGSFRDLQRHRNGVIPMPLLTTAHGFEEWYLTELGPEIESKARALVAQQTADIAALPGTPVQKQYYTALGYIVPTRVMWGLPAAVYVMELRSAKPVHPTLRQRIHEMIRVFRSHYGDITLHVDMDQDDWTIRRGQQTITERT